MQTPSAVAADLKEAVEGLRELFDGRAAEPGAAHDIRAAILVELAVEPMHGHQVIQAIAARSGGVWTPAPGAVYPTLQLLVDEGLVVASQDGERKVYTLTESGRDASAAAAASDRDTLGSGASTGSRRGDAERALALPRAGAKLGHAMAQFRHSATQEQTDRAVAIVDEARRQLYAILAEG
jgi:DNA-binding PadR family transcriptional regulator